MIKIISRVKNPFDVYEDLVIRIDKKNYNFQVLSIHADRFEWMLRRRMGFKALNYLKRWKEVIKDERN